jgi:hypothetical protein
MFCLKKIKFVDFLPNASTQKILMTSFCMMAEANNEAYKSIYLKDK